MLGLGEEQAAADRFAAVTSDNGGPSRKAVLRIKNTAQDLERCCTIDLVRNSL